MPQRSLFNRNLPNPGSHKAFKLGCTCGMLQNQFGLGSDISGQTAHWIVDEGCVMHTQLAHALDAKASNDERKLFTSLYLNDPTS